MLARSATGFIATSTLGMSPGVRISWSRDVDLERRDPSDGPGWRPDLGREVRHGREVVAEEGAHIGEPVPGELHAVAGVAGEADHDAVEHLRLEVVLDGHSPLVPLGRCLPSRSLLASGRPTPRAAKQARIHHMFSFLAGSYAPTVGSREGFARARRRGPGHGAYCGDRPPVRSPSPRAQRGWRGSRTAPGRSGAERTRRRGARHPGRSARPRRAGPKQRRAPTCRRPSPWVRSANEASRVPDSEMAHLGGPEATPRTTARLIVDGDCWSDTTSSRSIRPAGRRIGEGGGSRDGGCTAGLGRSRRRRAACLVATSANCGSWATTRANRARAWAWSPARSSRSARAYQRRRW